MILVIDHPRREGKKYSDQYRLFRDDQEKEVLEWAEHLGFESVGPFAELIGPMLPAREGVATVFRHTDIDIMILRLGNP